MKIKHFLILVLFLSNSITSFDLWLKVINKGQLMVNSDFNQQNNNNKCLIAVKDSNCNIPSKNHFLFTFSNNAITYYTSNYKNEGETLILNNPFTFSTLGNFKEGYCILIQTINSKLIICADDINQHNMILETLNKIKKLHLPSKTIVNNALQLSYIPTRTNINIALPGNIEERSIRETMKKMISDTEKKIEESRIKLNQELTRRKIEQDLSQREEIKKLQNIKQNYRMNLIKEIMSINPLKCKGLLGDSKKRIKYCNKYYSSEEVTNCSEINQFCYYCCVKDMNLLGDRIIKECNDNCNNL